MTNRTERTANWIFALVLLIVIFSLADSAFAML